MTHPTHVRSNVEFALIAVVIVLIVAGGAVCIQPECFPTAEQQLVKKILVALELRQPESYVLARSYLSQFPANPFAIALAAEAAAASFEYDAAFEHYRKLPADEGRWELIAELGLARRSDVAGLVSDVERHLRRVLELDPDHLEANSRLSHILQIAGRNWEAIPAFFLQLRRGKCRGDELLGIAAPERFFRWDDHPAGDGSREPDILVNLASARRLIYDNHSEEAEVLLRQITQEAPSLGEAQGRLGRIIYDRGDAAEFLDWRARLPESARNHPEVWFVQGMQARRLGQAAGAVRCFLETLTLAPNHLGATTQIAASLGQIGRSDVAQQFGSRAQLLGNLESQLNIARGEISARALTKVRDTCAELGRFWEAAGWSYVLTHLKEVPVDRSWKELLKWERLAVRDAHPTSARFNPVLTLRRSDFSEPNWGTTNAAKSDPPQVFAHDEIQWSFVDDAERVGIDFRYFEGTTEQTRLQHIFNVVGGGLAAIDFDLDGWCDLYLAQANDWRNESPQPDYPDRLFRNQEGRFHDVTTQAGLGDLGFTHGVCAGDFDQDGFDDIHIGNLGPNRLYRNNGDGTFRDVTDAASVAGNEWTTSSVLADFNGDALPDLYVANYSVIEETAKKECNAGDGTPKACTPDLLTAEFHRLYLNLGDGSFRDVTLESGMRQPNGRGLGLVVWDFGGDGRLGLFVANDTSANFLLINNGNSRTGVPEFREEGAIRGVAFDSDGKAQACMGVAAGDANGDGRLDMYITNFFAESDALYVQRDGETFDDLTRQFNLRDSGFWTLGFGCQFADFDNDGWEDLIATNGHVDQQSRRGDPDRAAPQLFYNVRGRKFDEIARERLGPYFQNDFLGRGLAKMDWNRDGRVDFAVSQLHGSFGLVTNKTQPIGQSLIIRLRGRTGTREPTGAVVTLRAGNRDISRFSTAGDGYLVTNERILHFAIPAEESAVEIRVRWPEGRIERWSDVRPGQELLLIERKAEPIVLRRFSAQISEDTR